MAIHPDLAEPIARLCAQLLQRANTWVASGDLELAAAQLLEVNALTPDDTDRPPFPGWRPRLLD